MDEIYGGYGHEKSLRNVTLETWAEESIWKN